MMRPRELVEVGVVRAEEAEELAALEEIAAEEDAADAEATE